MAAPYQDSLDHTRDALGLVFLLVRRYVGRYGHRMLQADGRLSNLYVSLREGQQLLHGEPDAALATRLSPVEHWPDAASVETDILAWRGHSEQRMLASMVMDPPPAPALEEFRALFRLSEAELTLLVAAAGPALSVDLARLYGFAWADFAVKTPTVGFLAELVADDADDIWKLAEAFTPSSPLVRHCLVTLGEESTRLATPVNVPEAVVAMLRGAVRPLEEILGDVCAVHEASGALDRDALTLSDGTLRRLEQALRKCVGHGSRASAGLALLGVQAAGRRCAMRTLAAELGLGLLEVDLAALLKRHNQSLDVMLGAIGREATLRRCAVLLRGDSLWEDAGDDANELARRLATRWTDLGPLTALTARRLGGPLLHLEGLVSVVAFGAVSSDQQRAVWTAALDARGRPVTADLTDALVAALEAPPGAIVNAVDAAHRDRVALGDTTGPLTQNVILRAHGVRSAHRLHEIAEPFQTTAEWADLVLPPETMAVLEEVLVHSRQRDRVFGEWGFKRKMSYGRGLSCLFAGPPGTGKTMAAGLIARALQRPSFRIDLSRVMSKWVGETEKNLAKVFDEAERSHVILLFDEADSLFGSRTEVKSANDRYANLEVNYLLQRMEAYDGITVLTTNFDKGIDEAFRRRIRFRVTFPFPDASAREQLWASMLPAEAPVEPGISFTALANRYEIAGGSIKNAVLRAAFLAAHDGVPIGLQHMEKAAVMEAREMGLLVRDGKGR